MKSYVNIKLGMLVTLIIFGAFGARVCLANPTTYTGSLSVAGGGLIATGVWNIPSTTLSWVVDDETTPGKWHYEYTLDVGSAEKNISHIIIEASDGDPYEQFTAANLFSPSSNPPTWLGTIAIGLQGLPPNPYIPEVMYGIKFNQNVGAWLVTVSFDSDRVPVWGDFYSKDGKTEGIDNTVYNAGFVSPDSDPTDLPSDGSVQNHLLVPDTYTTYIPAPGAVILAGIGTVLVGTLRRRKML